MTDDPRVEQLLDELLGSHATPEEVCQSCPELLAEVRTQWRRLRRVRAALDTLFPAPDGPGAGPPDETAAYVCDAVRSGPGASPPAGSHLPRVPGYEVQAVLGSGGMGVVYKAQCLRLNRPVALKMLLAGAYAGRHERTRFQREAEAVAALRHPHVVQVYEVGELDGRPYYTMEFLEGGSLAEGLAGVPKPAPCAVGLLATLADAVGFAHDHGIIHRDLKPANVLLTADGTPKITDFGIARRINGPEFTATGARIGTPSYMAPEQATGPARAVGPAVDVYALGAILYEILTGRPPFRAESAAETERQVIAEEPVPPSRLNAQVPRDLETICLKCLHKAPARRYASARELADDLRRFLDGAPIRARPVGPIERAVKWTRRRPAAAVLVVALLGLIGATAGATAWVQHENAAREKETALREGRAREAVENALARAADLRREERWREARHLLADAATRLADANSDDLESRLAQAQADLRLAEYLERIRQNRTSPMYDSYEYPLLAKEYSRVFAGAGIRLDDVEAAAAHVRASAIRDELLAALDDWAFVVFELNDEPMKDRLLRVAQLADPDPLWRDRFRSPAAWRSRKQLAKLADDVSSASPPPATHQLALVGVLLGKLGATADSTRLLRDAQQRRPADFWLNWEMGNALRRDKKYSEAVGYFQAALALRPEYHVVHNGLGVALLEAGRYEESIAVFRRGLAAEPKDLKLRRNLVLALARAHRWPEAEAECRLAREADPASAEPTLILAAALEQDKQYEEAARVYAVVLDVDPKNSVALRNRPGTLVQLGRIEEAAAGFRRFTELEPTDPIGYSGLGQCLRALGRYPEAAAAFEARAARDPHRGSAYRDLGWVYVAQRQWAKAADNYGRALELDPPGNGEAWFEYAAVQLLAGDREGYRRSCARVLELGAERTPNVRPYHVARAYTLAPAEAADLAKVSELSARELRRYGSQFWSLTERGALLGRAGQLEEAVPLLERSLTANAKPGAAVLNWLWLAFAYHQLGQADEARRWLDRAAAWLDQLGGEMPARPDTLGLDLHNWLEAQVLRREVGALLR
jgi:serine/threonine-protein kinase